MRRPQPPTASRRHRSRDPGTAFVASEQGRWPVPRPSPTTPRCRIGHDNERLRALCVAWHTREEAHWCPKKLAAALAVPLVLPKLADHFVGNVAGRIRPRTLAPLLLRWKEKPFLNQPPLVLRPVVGFEGNNARDRFVAIADEDLFAPAHGPQVAA